MSEYERRAWEKLSLDEQARRDSWRSRGTGKVSEVVSGAVSAAGAAVKRIPGADHVTQTLDDGIKVALTGAAQALFMPAVSSVSIERRIRNLRKKYPEIGDSSPFTVLDLRVIDKGRPKQILPLIGAVESAGVSLAITGLEVSTTVSGGATAGAIVLAITGDVAASLALLGRAVAEVAVHYGYDPNEPEEEIFLMGVLSYSSASSLPAKTAALAGLSRLVQQMMRQATWNELHKDILVKVIQTVFTTIGANLTHKRLAQVVPVVGGVLSAGLSYDMLHRAVGDATRLYRVRYLSDKHGLSFEDWAKQAHANYEAEPSGSAQEADEQYIDVASVLQRAIREREEPRENLASGTSDAQPSGDLR